MKQVYKVKPGYHKVGKGRRINVGSPCELEISKDNSFKIRYRYFPISNGFIIALCTIVTMFFVSSILLSRFNFSNLIIFTIAFIVTAIWMLFINTVRNIKVEITENDIEKIIADENMKEIAVYCENQNKKNWICFNVDDKYEKIIKILKTETNLNIEKGEFKKSHKGITIFFVVILLIIINELIKLFDKLG